MLAKKLLIVDDEVAIQTTLAEVFQQAGYVVRVASDGFTALAQMRDALPDVLLSDLNMPGMSGFELLSVVRRRLPAVYVIATSGAYQGESVPDGIAADSFYEKASNFGTLLRIVRDGAMASLPQVTEARVNAPLWITPLVDEKAGGSYAMMSCPQCLRGQLQRLDGDALTMPLAAIRETTCRDCAALIRYSVVKALDPATSQPYGFKVEARVAERRGSGRVRAAGARVEGWG
jgi:CheY-like chemotaxis protein